MTSTSTGRSGYAARTASYAGTTPPAATTWLSLTIAMSESEKRWLVPPPHRTAYFWRARWRGSVLRVSRTRARVPASASTQREVAVATPERWEAKLRAVRSAVSRARVGPDTRITTSPAAPATRRGPGRRPHRGVDTEEHQGGHAEPGDDTRLTRGEDAFTRRVGAGWWRRWSRRPRRPAGPPPGLRRSRRRPPRGRGPRRGSSSSSVVRRASYAGTSSGDHVGRSGPTAGTRPRSRRRRSTSRGARTSARRRGRGSPRASATRASPRAQRGLGEQGRDRDQVGRLPGVLVDGVGWRCGSGWVC